MVLCSAGSFSSRHVMNVRFKSKAVNVDCVQSAKGIVQVYDSASMPHDMLFKKFISLIFARRFCLNALVTSCLASPA